MRRIERGASARYLLAGASVASACTACGAGTYSSSTGAGHRRAVACWRVLWRGGSPPFTPVLLSLSPGLPAYFRPDLTTSFKPQFERSRTLETEEGRWYGLRVGGKKADGIVEAKWSLKWSECSELRKVPGWPSDGWQEVCFPCLRSFWNAWLISRNRKAATE